MDRTDESGSLAGLDPALVWKHFDAIRRIPRGSGAEDAVRDHVERWAAARGLETARDGVGNLVVRVPASPGREGRGMTVLQGHLDMVNEKNADVAFDFASEGIRIAVDGEFVRARGTTLGADNGIGVAAALAVAEDDGVAHPPLEILLTVDEETGMSGAFGLGADLVRGRRMLNLDTEEAGAVYVGCSGGGDVVARFDLGLEARRPGTISRKVEVRGLAGGHSGLDIHENRANAIKCLGRVLLAVERAGVDYRVFRIMGGSKRNAIPREARAGLCVAESDAPRLGAIVDAVETELRREFAGVEPGLTVAVEAPPHGGHDEVLRGDGFGRLLRAILASPSGVLAMSRDVPGLVETSNNLGVVASDGGVVEVVHCSRSSVGSALEAVRAGIEALYRLAGAEVGLPRAYPGWKPDLSSPLLRVALAAHARLFDSPAQVKAVHAGLECGLIGERCAGLDMVSIGPDIRGAHSPAERVGIASVGRFYAHLGAILAELD